jgi:hypothetical protein
MRGTVLTAGAAAAAAAAAVVLAAGCGTVQYRSAAGQDRGTAGHGRTTAATTPAPPTITRQQAERLARDLLSRAPLPAGAGRRTGPPVRVLAGPSGTQSGIPSVTLHQLWTVPAPMTTVYGFLKQHVPAGMTVSSTSQLGQAAGVPEHTKIPAGRPPKLQPRKPLGVQPGNVGTVIMASVSYQLSRLPAGVSAATLSMAVAPAGKDVSEVRADVQVIWYPPRSAAEYVPPGMRAVTITASFVSPKPGSVTRTFTSPATVGRLAALLNGAHASTGGTVFCTAIWVTFRLAFAAALHAAPSLVATDGGCGIVQVSALGRAQPALQAPPGLHTLLAGLMHVRPVPGVGVLTPVTSPAVIPPPAACGIPPRGVFSVPGMRETRDAGTLKLLCPQLPRPAP